MLATTKIWHALKNEITEKDLRRIANSDYGYDVDKHYSVLSTILKTDTMPTTLQWEPGEVLCLTRWSDYKGSSNIKERPEVVLFCCVLLLADLCSEEFSNHSEGATENLIIGLDIANYLQGDWLLLYHDLLSQIISNLPLEHQEEEYLYLSLARYISSDLLTESSLQEQALEHLIHCERHFIANQLSFNESITANENILSYMCYTQKIKLWEFYLEAIEKTLQEARMDLLTQPNQ
ncbi:MAG: hypothetical protein ACRBHB_12930 [Arenicella sp.]